MKKEESLAGRVKEYISGEIKSGKLNPGDKLSESRICKALEISRTPTREALIKLASDGLLEHSPRKGFSVKEITLQIKIDTYVLIANLDALAGKLAIDHMTEKDFLAMEELVDMIDIAIKYKNIEKYSKLQDEFHKYYLYKSNNIVLIETMERLMSSFIQIIYKNDGSENHYEVFQDINNEHREILKLFRDKDKDALSSYLENTHWAIKYDDMI